jgi:type II secretory pathway pseudopilin PulG
MKGSTFIELILYISIIAIVMTALIPTGLNFVGTGQKSSFEQEVISQARYVSERIKYEIRNANSITSVSASSITLSTTTDANTTIDLSGGKVRISYGGNTPVNLNSNDTTISSLVFTDYSAAGITNNIAFVMTITDNINSSHHEYISPTYTIRSAAEVRGK